VRAVVVVTSDKCYENRESTRGYREDDRLGGHDPYSSSKACAEIIAAAYQRSYFSASATRSPAVATARAGNVIGGGDWSEDRLIPDTVRAIAGNGSPAIRNPSAVRPWQHVLEPLRGYMMLAERLAGDQASAYTGAWNFGPGESDARPVSWVVEQLLALWGLPPRWNRAAGDQPHETNFLRLDSSKASRALGWNPVLRIEQALNDTVSWYRGHAAGKDMREFSLAQIGAYAGLLRNRERGEGAASR
jgi:CDP-glucose 4,6-dehydratase